MVSILLQFVMDHVPFCQDLSKSVFNIAEQLAHLAVPNSPPREFVMWSLQLRHLGQSGYSLGEFIQWHKRCQLGFKPWPWNTINLRKLSIHGD